LLVRIGDGGMAVQMAEYVSHAVIRHFREFDAYDREVANGNWAFRKPRRRNEFPVGIMGLGVLGQRVAQAVAQFEFPLRGWSRTPKHIEGIECFAGDEQFDAFLRGTRMLVCLLPLTPDTEGIMNRDTLGKLMPGGYVINVARGAHLVEEDLIALLDSGHLAGAVLDVFRTEPLPASHPFWTHPKVTLTPHTSARTLRDETIEQIAGKIRKLERGEPIAGVVDAHRGY
jgi:glyoxylate/hydroxypyruvate reductase A